MGFGNTIYQHFYRYHQSGMESSSNQTAEKVKVKAALKEQEKKALEKKHVAVSAAYSLKWLIAGIVLIGAAGCWVYRKIK